MIAHVGRAHQIERQTIALLRTAVDNSSIRRDRPGLSRYPALADLQRLGGIR